MTCQSRVSGTGLIADIGKAGWEPCLLLGLVSRANFFKENASAVFDIADNWDDSVVLCSHHDIYIPTTDPGQG